MRDNEGPRRGPGTGTIVGVTLLVLFSVLACVGLSGVIAFWIICGVR